MKYSELVKSIVTNVLEECGITEEKIKVGHDTYNFDSLDKKTDRAELAKKLAKKLAAQNRKIDDERMSKESDVA